MLTLSGLQKVENVHTNFMGTKKTRHHHLSTDWGFIILIGSLNPCPVVLPILCHYCIIFYMYVFLQGCACSGVLKGEACAECFLKSKANIGGWVDLSSISFSTNIERKKSFTCKLGCKITAIVVLSTEFSWHGTTNLSDLSPWTSTKSKHRSL